MVLCSLEPGQRHRGDHPVRGSIRGFSLELSEGDQLDLFLKFVQNAPEHDLDVYSLQPGVDDGRAGRERYVP